MAPEEVMFSGDDDVGVVAVFAAGVDGDVDEVVVADAWEHYPSMRFSTAHPTGAPGQERSHALA